MQNFELKINQEIKLVLEIDFELDKYINGDINIYLSHKSDRILLAETQILYLSELFINVMSAVLAKKDETYCVIGKELLEEYIKNLDNEEPNTLNTDWKTLLDFQQVNGAGYVIFLYWNDSGNYLQIYKIESKNKKHSFVKNMLTEKITNEQIEIWIQSLSELKSNLQKQKK